MKKILLIIYLVVIISLNLFGTAKAAIEDDLSTIDGYRHSSKQFLPILDSIRQNFPQYSNQKIGDMIAVAYKNIREYKRNVTIYEIAQDIKDMAITSSQKIKLEEMIAAYIVLKRQGSIR